ncbi:MAG TPA: hypothetical protein VGM09_24680 [Bradyrhizobium sp.]|jgi:hypothetical protein
MWTAAVVFAVLSTLASVAMTGYGVLVLMLSHFDPMHTDRVGTNFGLAIMATFMVIPTICIIASLRLAYFDRRSSLFVGLLPFALVALGVYVIHEFPWPAPPAPVH